MVEFICKMDGKCCRAYWISVTHLDAFRIMHYGDFKPKEFLRSHTSTSSSLPSIRIESTEYYLALRKEKNVCVFLLDSGKCSIHEFKPLTCRFYPFVYSARGSKAIDINICGDAIGSCPGLIRDRKPIDNDLKRKLLAIANARLAETNLYRDAIGKLLAEFNATPSFEEAIEFLLDEARKDYHKHKAAGLWMK